MKFITLTLLALLFSLSALAQYHRPGPGGYYRPGPGHYRPGPGGYRPFPGPGGYRPFPGPRPYPYPRPYPVPVPAPYPSYRCTALMINDWHEVIRSYRGECRVVMDQCYYDLRFYQQGLRCVQEGGSW